MTGTNVLLLISDFVDQARISDNKNKVKICVDDALQHFGLSKMPAFTCLLLYPLPCMKKQAVITYFLCSSNWSSVKRAKRRVRGRETGLAARTFQFLTARIRKPRALPPRSAPGLGCRAFRGTGRERPPRGTDNSRLTGALRAANARSATRAAMSAAMLQRGVAFVDDDQPAGALLLFEDRVLIQRRGRARVDQLALDPFPGQGLGRLAGVMHHSR